LAAFPDWHSFLMSVARLCAWLVLLSLFFLPLEKLFAVHPRQFLRKTLYQDLAYYFINGLVPSLLLAAPLASVAYLAHAAVPQTLQSTIASLPLWQRALAGFIVGEVGFYWGHRWAHAIPFLWRFHSIHHSAEQIYFLISSRAHPLDNVFMRLCGLIPVCILGIATPLTPDGGTVAAMLVIVMTMWGFFIHSNIRWRFGPLEWVIATPGFHHWHHTMGNLRDRNFAPMLPLMDWIFGTFHLPKNQWPAAYGIENPLPTSLGKQLLFPLSEPLSQENRPMETDSIHR
jgi:sterol desaturase/sphingolipid hydroxylase (fatty acid hydroxylase superfamily)